MAGQTHTLAFCALPYRAVGCITVIGLTLIAAAPRAWLIVGIVATCYIVSRGLAKAGNAHRTDDATRGC